MSKSDRNITKNPKVMFNQGERKFTAMDPKDDAVVDKTPERNKNINLLKPG